MSRSKKKRGCNPLVAILIAGFVLLAVLVVGLFGGKIALEKWLQGEGFQEWVRKTAEKKLHADVNIDSLSWQGKKLSIEKITGHGYPEADFAKFDINASRAQLLGIGKTVTISDINITRANVEISEDRLQRAKSQTPPPVAIVNAASTDSVAPPKIPGFLKAFAPQRVELGDIIIQSASVQVKDESGAVEFSVNDSQAQITPNLDNESAEILIKKGDLFIDELPEMKIISSAMRWQDDSLFIKESGANLYGDGHVATEGEINFKEDDPVFDLDLTLSSIDVKEVLPDDWKNRISGTIRGPVQVTGPSEQLVQEGTLYLDNGVIEGIKILKQIATFTKSDLFSRIVLNEAQSNFTRKDDNIELTNINIHSNDLIKIEGNVTIEGENLAGIIQLGVAPKTIRLIPGAREKVFTETREGLVWTPVKIGGTTSKFEQDLSARLIGAATSDLPGIVDQIGGLLGFGSTNKQPETENKPGEEEKKDGIRGLIQGIEKNVDEDSDIGKALKLFGPLLNRQ